MVYVPVVGMEYVTKSVPKAGSGPFEVQFGFTAAIARLGAINDAPSNPIRPMREERLRETSLRFIGKLF